MKPFISFYGAKWSMARRLERPQRSVVVEPFAGSAGYSLYWEPHTVILVERDPVIWSVWKYLQQVQAKEIMALPVNVSALEDLPQGTCQEAKWLIGFWFNAGCNGPSKQRSNWARSPLALPVGWRASIRLRIATQVDKIRHWRIIHGSWEDAPDVEAHWHIDPPYQGAGHFYKYNEVDYRALAAWCRSRAGFVHVCENVGADWLPFVEFSKTKGTPIRKRRRTSKEVLYQQGALGVDLFPHHERSRDEQSRGSIAESHRREAAW